MNVFDIADFESTIRDFEFTRRAQNQILNVVESEDFADMDSEAIFQYLYKTMEVVSFKDYLKRYIYERAGIREPFRTVSDDVYREIIDYSFEENAAPHSFEPSSTRWSATIKGWLRHDSVRRSAVFLLGFGLRMSDLDVSSFLTKVLKEEDFDFTDPRETVFWHCFGGGRSWAEAQAILREAEERASGGTAAWTAAPEEMQVENRREALEAHLDDREALIRYLICLGGSGKNTEKQHRAYEHFCSLLEQTRTEVARMSSEDLAAETAGKRYTPEEITSADIEQVICCGIPFTKSGNLQKASSSLLSRQFHNFRLSRQRIDGVLKKQLQVDRYDLITLEFFLYSRKAYDLPEDRVRDYMDDMNRILRESGLKELHAVNPYEAFVLMCLLADVPLATYADVWEMSFS